MFYRRYRPKFFREVVGQEIPLRILKSFLKIPKPPHGYLFAGERGTGKTSVARIYAKALNCLESKDSEPCGHCRICQLFNENRFLDLIEIDAASHRKIEDIRNLQEHIGFRPIQGKYKVFIIDEAHSLTEEASNALLKTLEEPPFHAIFILATTEPDRILPTIHSRVQRIDFRRISLPQVVAKLKLIAENEGFDYEEQALYLIAEEANGSLRDAETLLEKIALSLNFHPPRKRGDEGEAHSKITEDLVADFLGYLSQNRVLEFLEIVSQKNINSALDFIFKIYSQGYDLNLFIKSFLKIVRQLLLLKTSPIYAKHLEAEKSQETIEKMKNLAEKFKIEDLKRLSYLFFEADLNLKKEPPSLLLPLELALIEYLNLKSE
jgi:DNA polymerase-3 subunit gamma/tau